MKEYILFLITLRKLKKENFNYTISQVMEVITRAINVV